jgi:hypothetical protein
MSNHTCAICGAPYGYVIADPTKYGEILICKPHYDFLESVKNSILTELLKAVK